MIGWFRFVLAWLVAGAHLGGPDFDRANAIFAVQGFFVVSGFLMTAILNGTYKDRPFAFWGNRFLKLFPAYYIVCAVILAAVALDPAHFYRDGWTLDWSPASIVANLTIVPLAFSDGHWRFIGPTWSIGVELLNYAILFALSARGPKFALAVLLAGAAWHAHVIAAEGYYVNARYWPWYAALVPFSVGALAFFANRRWPVRPRLGVAAAVLWAINLAAADWVDRGYAREIVMWYANIGLVAVLTAALAPLRQQGVLRRLDGFVGDLAYPVFLVHGIASSFTGLAIASLGANVPISTPIYLAACVPLVLIASIVVARLASYLIEPLRDQVRAGGARTDRLPLPAPALLKLVTAAALPPRTGDLIEPIARGGAPASSENAGHRQRRYRSAP